MFASCELTQNSEIQKLQNDSLEKIESLINDTNFQKAISVLESNTSCSVKDLSFESALSKVHSSPEEKTELYIFVSFSLGEKALLNLAHDAKSFGGALVLRGFIEGSYAKTAQSLQKIISQTGQGFLIDPELFNLFSIKAVPTFILSKPFQVSSLERTQTPIHDRLQGHVSMQYALETFAKEGDLSQEAQSLLKRESF
ncbi:MAG: type-F conjugative transfer system pilin assembly protein TrbC [Proteobacteria bacterium]|nr:type-F conjugative transfer system pilin assembly protein TrbC [Pseudomonadota bacterium]